MTAVASFWNDPAFAEFLPYIKVEPAHDTAKGRNRLEVLTRIPTDVRLRALAFKGRCVACGREINVFRSRGPVSQRAPHVTGHPYLAATCELEYRIGCARGQAARNAYKAIAALALEVQGDQGQQGGLL